MFAVFKMELSGKTVYGSVLKTTQLSAHAQNHASPVQSYSPGGANVHPMYRKPKNGCHGNVP